MVCGRTVRKAARTRAGFPNMALGVLAFSCRESQLLETQDPESPVGGTLSNPPPGLKRQKGRRKFIPSGSRESREHINWEVRMAARFLSRAAAQIGLGRFVVTENSNDARHAYSYHPSLRGSDKDSTIEVRAKRKTRATIVGFTLHFESHRPPKMAAATK